MSMRIEIKNSVGLFAGIFLLVFLTAADSGFAQTAARGTGEQDAAKAPAKTTAAAKAQETSAPSPSPAAKVLTSQSAKSPAAALSPTMPPVRNEAAAEDANKVQPYRGPVTSGIKPIVVEKSAETVDQRLERAITLDVREMNVLDVLKFLALKGDFNMVTGSQVAGRVTLFLKNVKIHDALDIIVISNNLAYYVEKDIVYVLSDAEYFSLFGKRFNDKNTVEIVQLKYAKPSYVLAALDSLKSALGKIIIDEDTGSVVMIDTPESIAKMRASLTELEAPLEPFVYSLQYAKADVVAEKLKARVDAQSVGSIIIDERSNKIIVRALPERRQELEKFITDMDQPTKEVLVEVRVLQVVFKPQMDFGIDWQTSFGDGLKFQNFMLAESALTSSSNLFTNYGKVAYGDINVDKFQTSLRALKQVADTRILSNPRLLVTNNEEAKIHVGDTVPYIISTTSGTGDNAITSEDVRFVDVGVKINITPTINDDGMVTMRLMPEISTVTTKITSQGGGIPQVNKTLLESTIMVKDGMTIILGGLKKENKAQTRKGLPVLMDIPYLGTLFSNLSETVEVTEIVIFITPHIITGDQDYRELKGTIKPPEKYSGASANVKVKDLGLTLKE